MQKVLNSMDRLITYSVWVCGALLFATAFLIAVEILMRKFFSLTMGGADEISSYVLAVSCSWGFGFALIRKGHVRIDILYRRFPAGVRFSLDLLSLALFLLYLLTLCYFAWLVLKTSFIKHSLANTPLQTPLWIPQGLWFLGLVVFAMVILLLLVGTLYHLVQGDFRTAQRLSGLSVSDGGKAEGGHVSLDGGER